VSWPKILVTGASGFIGGRIVETLHRDGAANLRAGVARLPCSADLAQLPVEIAVCDLNHAGSLDVALQGVEVVIHCARTANEADSAAGTRRLLDRSKAAGVRKFIYLSSVAVYGDADGLVEEETPAAGGLTPYARGKLASEHDCRSAASPSMAVSILRPALVYGPGSELWTTPYIARLRSGRWKRLGAGGEGRANLIYVDDVAAFAAFLARRDLGDYTVFNANGPDVPTWNDYLDLFADMLGAGRPIGLQTTSLARAALLRPLRVLERRLLTCGAGQLTSLSARSPLIGRAVQRLWDDLALNPSYQELKIYRLGAVYSMERAARAGFAPQTSLRQGLARCVEWAAQTGHL
jgi:nucleoside-diphosphate-sugar epimerase